MTIQCNGRERMLEGRRQGLVTGLRSRAINYFMCRATTRKTCGRARRSDDEEDSKELFFQVEVHVMSDWRGCLFTRVRVTR